MYSIILNTGNVYRTSDLKIVAPAQNSEDTDYQEYISWINEGNSPTEYNSPGEDYIFNGTGFNLKLEVLKEQKQNELNIAFDNQFQYGKFQCSFGFMVDNRRYGNKNDKDNIQSLIDIGINIFKDADGEFHQLSPEQLYQIKLEMTADGLKKYQTKWYFEGLIQSAQTNEELNFEIKF